MRSYLITAAILACVLPGTVGPGAPTTLCGTERVHGRRGHLAIDALSGRSGCAR